jgi:hypothetical protein
MDYDEVFVPMTCPESVRLILALAAEEGWGVHQMDVKSAFLNGELEDEVYAAHPPGFIIDGKEHRVLHLSKALYGHKQAPRAWNTKLDTYLSGLGFTKCATEHAVYGRGTSSSRLLVGVYVDDLIITGSDRQEIARFKQEMQELFAMSDLGLLSFYLGIEVRQSGDGISINQSAYPQKLP